MTIEEKIENWINKRNEFPDTPGILEILIETEHTLENLSQEDVPPWLTLEEIKADFEKQLKELKILRDYAIKYNIKAVL